MDLIFRGYKYILLCTIIMGRKTQNRLNGALEFDTNALELMFLEMQGDIFDIGCNKIS